jgi:GxxExxY protein
VNPLNEITGAVVDSAIAVHSELGPGLLESAYRSCLAHELRRRTLSVIEELPIPLVYRGLELDAGYRIDLLVGGAVIVEVKAVAQLLPVHDAQLISYLKLSGHRVGLLINFHVPHLRDGIRRFVNNPDRAVPAVPLRPPRPLR